MDRPFQNTSAYWARFSEYEYRQGDDGHTYLMPTAQSKPAVYDPMKEADTLVVDALNVGRLAMKRDADEEKLKQAILDFVTKYGLLGFMPALPTTPEFMNYGAVYLPKNHFIKEEAMAAQEYLALFFPFRKPDVYKDGSKAQWDVNDRTDDRTMVALAMTFSNDPMTVGMSLQRIYAERYDWLVTQFRDWAFMLVSTFLFYEDKDDTDELTRDLYRQGVSAFGGKAPTFHVSLYEDKPRIVWDFYSLLMTIQTMFGFALTDESKPLLLCKHCNLAFISGQQSDVFCSEKCKGQFKIYKGRGKK